MTSLSTRPFADGDFETWYPLWRGYQAFYRVDIPDEVTRVTWSRLIDPDEPMRGTFGLDGDTVVGIVHCVQHRSTWTRGDYVYLQDLFTAPHARGRGVGRLLIRHVYAEATARGCSRVHWLTHESNRDAMQLYDRIADRSGFVQYRKLL